MAAASAVATAQTPPTEESEVAPQRGSARKLASSMGSMTKRHQQVDQHDHRQRQHRQGDGRRRRPRAGRAWISAGSNSRAVEARSRNTVSSPGRRRPRGHRHRSPPPWPARGVPAAAATTGRSQHDSGRQDAQAWRREGRGAEERHRDGVLDGWRARQRRHGEGGGAQRDGGRHQPARDIRPRGTAPCAMGAQHEDRRRRG
jgi:hypothetical protein